MHWSLSQRSSSRQRFFLMLSLLLVFVLPLVFTARTHGAVEPWDPNYRSYAVGDLVSYNNVTYRCIQAHTSQPGWTPPATPALWQPASTATSTPGAATATPASTATPTRTAAPTATPGTGCSYPAWDRAKVYYGGDLVSHNGRGWRAQWWTQGEEPGVSTSGVWVDLGPCGNSPTATPTRPPATATPTSAPATPTRTAVPSPTPTLDPNRPALPRRVIVGYWHNFDNGSGYIRLRNVSTKYDVIQVAFAEPTGSAPGVIGFTPYGATKDQFKADIAYLKSIGKKVLISIGGANGQVQLVDGTARQNFVSSMKSIISEYGFDGLDIDFEGHSLYLNQGDRDIRNPTTPVITNLIAAVRELRNHFGSNFMLTMAPETFFVQVGYTHYGGSCVSCDNRAGAYLPVIHALRDILTLLHVQHYNSGPIRALDNNYYSMGNADFHVAMAEMVLQGFPVAGDSNNFFPALRPDQVAIGLPANVNAGGGFTPVAEVQRALDYLIKGTSFGGSYRLRNSAGYPALRGLMTWSINWDAFNNFEFSNNHRAYLDRLP